MKKNVLTVSVGLLSAFLLSSCMDDGNVIHVSYGVIKHVISEHNYEILTDKGNTLAVTKSYNNIAIENDKRVLVSYEILSDREKSKKIYEVQVNGFYYLLSKPLVKESFILEQEEARRDSIGNDPFLQVNAWFGGDFINIDFEMLYGHTASKKHLINLVYDDTRAAADTIFLALHHNAYGETPGKGILLYKEWGSCSFQLSDLLPEGVTSRPVKLMWTEYEHNFEVKECSDEGVFRKGSTDDGYTNHAKRINFIEVH
jgi:hypothetical protein